MSASIAPRVGKRERRRAEREALLAMLAQFGVQSMVFEHRSEPVISRMVFLARLARSTLLAGGVIGFSLGMGAVGYHCTESLPWIDAVLNAAMILTGMGPVSTIKTTAGKLFATGYALFSGLVFVSTSAIVLAPIGHRMLHRLHLEETSGPRR